MDTLRLLAAARQTYEIIGDGVVPDLGWPPSANGYVGYTDQTVGFRSGADNEDAGFTATVAEGVIVAIRGTTPPADITTAPRQVIVDWASDAVALLALAGGTPPGFPGKVHFGFYRSFMRLWQKLGPAVQAKVQAYAGANGGQKPIFVTGHSKGGAVSALVAWRLHLDYPDATIVVRTFAGPRIGDTNFVTAYDAAIPDHIRYEYDEDVVPHLPLSPTVGHQLGWATLVSAFLSVTDLGYCPVGQLGFIATDGSIIGDTAGLEAQRVTALFARMNTGGFGYIAGCHSIDPPASGYVRASYP